MVENMKNINVGIIGYGLSGRIFHGAIINAVEGFSIKKIVTTNLEKRDQAIKDIPDVKVVRAATEIFVDEDIDLVVISTPNVKHAELAEAALRSGKHVVIEKPFTVTSKEARDLIDTAKEMNRMISVYHNRRYDSDFRTVKAIIDTGKLGRLVEYEAHFDRFRNTFKDNAWREKDQPGAGILYDLGSHLIDQALCLFGLPTEIYGDIRAQRQGETDDNFELILYYPDLKVTLKAGMLVKELPPHFTLYGTSGSFVKYGLDVQEGHLKEGLRPVDDTWGVEPKDLWGRLDTEDKCQRVKSLRGDYRDYYKNIYNHLRAGDPLDVKAEEACHVIEIIEKAMESNKNKARVAL